MQKNKLEKMDLTLYSEKLDNGLEVFIVPKENVNGIYVTFTTKFGSIHDEFVPIGKTKMYKVPKGVAHFLEHKMFEQEDGTEPFNFYSERGSDCNANTSNYKTTYLFSGPNFFKENLEYLLDFVQSPYFTDENVEKEKGIIEQEIKMYDDNPFWCIYDGLIYNSFIKHPIKYPIAGTVDTISKITKDDLYTCYNTFYHPSNMFVVVTGNLDPKEVISIIKYNQEQKKFKKARPIKMKEYDEPDKVEKKEEIKNMEIEIPKVGVAYKINIEKINLDINKIKRYLNILFDVKLGSVSEFCDMLKQKGVIDSNIDINLVSTDKHLLFMFIVETKYTDEFIKLLDKELENLIILESDFERKKKIQKSSCIYKSDSIYSVNSKIVNNIINYGNVVYDEYKYIDDLKIEELNEIIKVISLKHKTVYYLEKE